MTEFTIALAGNPNTGKTTVFNALTGSRQHVGNWPGKTVERREGDWRQNGHVFRLVDLPGAYSLSTYTLEEAIARQFLVEERPDLVLAVADAANLERNLYLVVQILETGLPALLVLNMADVARARGVKIDVPALSNGLGVPVIVTAASKGEGLEHLRQAVAAALIAEATPS